MNTKAPRPAAPSETHRAEIAKGLSGTFNPQTSQETSEQQDDFGDWIDHLFLGRRLQQGAAVLLGPFARPYSLDDLDKVIENTFPELDWRERSKLVEPLINAIHWLGYTKLQSAFNERYSLARICRMIAKCHGVCAPGRTGPGLPNIPLHLSDQPIEALLAALTICGFKVDRRKTRPGWWRTNISSTGLARLGKRGALPKFAIRLPRTGLIDP
jgi:hypothetical protein